MIVYLQQVQILNLRPNELKFLPLLIEVGFAGIDLAALETIIGSWFK